MKLFDLSGKRAIVTGGTRGLGRGMAEGLLEAGAKVVIIGSSERVHETAAELRAAGFDCGSVRADLGIREQRQESFREAVALLGGLDILANAAGVQHRCPASDFPMEAWQRVIDVNLTGCFEMSQLAAKYFLKEEKTGKIINVASMLSFFGGSNVVAYAASKGGVAQFSKDMSNELAGKGICVNCIAPGYMATDLTAALTDPSNPAKKEITGRIPVGRWGTPEDMKGVTVFLASAASDYVSGAVIPVDGGYLVR